MDNTSIICHNSINDHPKKLLMFTFGLFEFSVISLNKIDEIHESLSENWHVF